MNRISRRHYRIDAVLPEVRGLRERRSLRREYGAAVALHLAREIVLWRGWLLVHKIQMQKHQSHGDRGCSNAHAERRHAEAHLFSPASELHVCPLLADAVNDVCLAALRLYAATTLRVRLSSCRRPCSPRRVRACALESLQSGWALGGRRGSCAQSGPGAGSSSQGQSG